MANKDYASEILARMESGTEDIYSKYNSLIAASDAKYDAAIKDLDGTYSAAANQTAAKNKIDLSNTMERLTDKGLASSGQSLHSELVSNAGLLNSLASLTSQKAKDTAAYRLGKQTSALELEAKKSEEAGKYRGDMYQSYLNQVNADRSYEQTQAKNDFDNQIKSAYLELDRQKAYTSASPSSAGGGITLKQSPKDYLQSIVDRCTTVDPGKKYKIVNKTQIEAAVREIYNDPNISQAYRYELLTYAKTLGYIATAEEKAAASKSANKEMTELEKRLRSLFDKNPANR